MAVFLPDGVSFESSAPIYSGGISSERSLGGFMHPTFGNSVLSLSCKVVVLPNAVQPWNAFCAKANRGELLILPIPTKHRAKRTTGIKYDMQETFPGSTHYDAGLHLYHPRDAQGQITQAADAQALTIHANIPDTLVEAGTWFEVGGHVYQVTDARRGSGSDDWVIDVDRRLRSALSVDDPVYFQAPRFACRALKGVKRGNETASVLISTSFEVTEAVEGYDGPA